MELLKLNARGEGVYMLQELLKEQDFVIEIDGNFGPKTERAVKNLQHQLNLKADGIVYNKTWTALINAKPGVGAQEFEVLQLNDRGDAVEKLQRLLNLKKSTIEIDGIFGKKTKTAVETFQEKHHSTANGIVGKNTWNSLIEKTELKPTKLPLLQKGRRGKSVEKLQLLLNNDGYNLDVDGTFGSQTEKAVKKLQEEFKLNPDGIVYTKTWSLLVDKNSFTSPKLNKKLLKESDLIQFSENHKIEIEVIKAINEVESRSSGFYNDGRPKLNFEGHIFWKELQKRGFNPEELKYDYEDVLYASWSKAYYKTDHTEWDRLDKAISIKNAAEVSEAAYASASYGLFQIMGFHYKALGYSDILRFVADMKKSEGKQLEVFGLFLKENKLVRYLQNHNWAEFSFRYNGPDYKKNKYDEILENAYRKLTLYA